MTSPLHNPIIRSTVRSVQDRLVVAGGPLDSVGQMSLFQPDLELDSSPTVSGRASKITPEWYGLAEEFLGQSEHLYPGITDWWNDRVVPDLEHDERMCQMVSVDGSIAAIAIARPDRRSSKLCTLRVDPAYRGMGLGQTLLRSTLVRLLRQRARRVHFTISEEIFDECGSFFAPYGFHLAHWKKGWYVPGMYEMAFSVRASTIRDVLSHQLPLFQGQRVVVLSVKPRYAAALEAGIKQVEFRRRFSLKARGAHSLVYVSSPVQEFRLAATIADVISDRPAQLWDRFGENAGCTKQEFDEYFLGAGTGYAIAFSGVRRLRTPVPLRSPELQAINYRPPQSFAMLPEDSRVVQSVVTAL